MSAPNYLKAIYNGSTTHSPLLAATTFDSTSQQHFLELGVANGTATNVDDWLDGIFMVFKASIMLLIIITAIFGNLLVIISVMRNRKLRLVEFLLTFKFSKKF